MREVVIDSSHAGDFESWRVAARPLLHEHIPATDLRWRLRSELQTDLLARRDLFQSELPARNNVAVLCDLNLQGAADSRVPGEFLRMAASVACHSHNERWDALYRVLFRLTHGEASLLDVATDPDVHRLMVMDKAVRRDVHKMHAFVRFRSVTRSESESSFSSQHRERPHNISNDSNDTHYIAWFEPQHHIVQHATPFFARRFSSMRWSILTPTECAHWNGVALHFTEGVARSLCPKEDELEELWRSYYAHIFNPARIATATMQAEMPQRYWNNLPEAQLIAGLKRDAPGRVLRMLQQMDAKPAVIPDDLRSCVGDMSEPKRNRYTSQQNIAPNQPQPDLDAPGAWDPEHDPGVTVARERVQTIDVTQLRLPGVVMCDETIVRTGTASWTDPTTLRRGVFYPDDVTTPEARLKYYAQHFSLVEVDSTFYVPPTRAMTAAWAARTSESFVFDIKAYALMTGHAAEVKRMPDWLRRLLPRSISANERVYANDLPVRVVDEVWQRFQAALNPLRDAGKLGPILLQFPRWFTPTRENANLLRTARERLGSSSAAIEFRNPEWVTARMMPRTQALLESLNLTYVIVDAPPGTASSMPPTALVTTPALSVVRLHGRRSDTWEARNAVVSERYRYLYDSHQLNDWSERIGTIAQQLAALRTQFPDMAKARQGVHVVFNNCHANYGTSNAIEITKTLIEFDKVRQWKLN